MASKYKLEAINYAIKRIRRSLVIIQSLDINSIPSPHRGDKPGERPANGYVCMDGMQDDMKGKRNVAVIESLAFQPLKTVLIHLCFLIIFPKKNKLKKRWIF